MTAGHDDFHCDFFERPLRQRLRVAWHRGFAVFVDRDREYASIGWLYVFWGCPEHP